MYRLGTGDVWMAARRKWPSAFADNPPQLLKPLGHAFVMSMVERLGPRSIIEVGHGATSATLDLLRQRPGMECWGLDADDVDKTVSAEKLALLRANYAEVRFEHGYLGHTDEVLPDNHFDMLFSVSVLEHVPPEAVPALMQDAFRVLKPGGTQVHSYDVWWRKDSQYMFDAIEAAGFKWVDPPSEMFVPWENYLQPQTASEALKGLTRVCFERPNVVTNVYSHAIPLENRVTHNWVTIFVAATKPF